MQNLISIKELSPILRISTVTIYRLLKSKLLPCHRIGRKFFFTEDDVKEYLNNCKLGTA